VHENRKSKAEKLFKQALKLDPQAVEAYNNLGTIYANRGEVEQAKAMFEQALAINPLYVLARCNLAMFALNEEKIEAAETLLSPLGELQEITPLGMVFLSFVRARLAVFKEQYAEARDNLKVALEINPDYAPAKDLLQRLDEIETISRGFAVWKERMARSHKALRTRQQSKLATNAPTLAEALNVYTKEVMTGMARAILPWGGWSTLKKAELTGYLVRELPTAMVLKHILADLRPAELSALRQVLANGGWLAWQTFEATYGNDQEESPYWQYHEPETVMGRLRLRGLLVETHADGELVLTVPVELRQPLQDYLPAEGGQEQT
jgi:tetratricopeptide (TPR) repeat protein